MCFYAHAFWNGVEETSWPSAAKKGRETWRSAGQKRLKRKFQRKEKREGRGMRWFPQPRRAEGGGITFLFALMEEGNQIPRLVIKRCISSLAAEGARQLGS